MTKTYDIKFRELVVAHYKKYKNPKSTCEDFKISKATLFRWIKLDGTGNLTPKKKGGKKPAKLKHYHFNRIFDSQSEVKTQLEFAKLLGVSQSTVSRSMRRCKDGLSFDIPRRRKRQKKLN